MDKASAINSINHDSEMFIIREVETDYTGYHIFYDEELSTHISTRFKKLSLSMDEFLSKETILDIYDKESIIIVINKLLQKHNINLGFTVERLSYCWIIKVNQEVWIK